MATIEKRASQGGKTTYRAKVRLKGFPSESATFERLTDAKHWVQDTESAIRNRRHFKTAEAKKHSLSDLINRYIRDTLPTFNAKERGERKRHLNFWKARIGAYSLADITPALIVEYCDELAKMRAPATVLRYMAALSHAFTIGADDWGWLDDSPMRKVSRPKLPGGRVRYLNDEERPKLLKACQDSSNSILYPVVVLALSTGMRRGEILGLRWQDVDLHSGFLILHKTKNGERRRVPLAGHALEVLQKHSTVRRIDSDIVFSNKDSTKPADLRKPWETALKTAEIDDFRFHDLRHSTASYLAMNGASLAEIAEVLGHKTLQMVKRYAHLSDSHTSKVVASMNAKIFN